MEIKLKATHTHAGIDYGPGDVIELDDASALWLISLDRAEQNSGDDLDDKSEESEND